MSGSLNSRPHPFWCKRLAPVFGATALLLLTARGPGVAQTTTSTAAATTTTIARELSVVIVHDIASGFTSTNQPLGQQRTVITVTNPGPETRFNEQMVVRFGAKPNTIYFVRDATGSVGVIEGPTSTWFHTIAVLPPKSSSTYTVTWNKVCPGRWAMGTRVGETTNWQVLQWIGPSTVKDNCPPDETANPTQPVLPWPAAFPVPPVISPIVLLTTTTGVASVDATSSTLIAPTTRASTVPIVSSTTTPLTASTTSTTPTALPSTTTVSAPLATTTSVLPIPATSTTLLFCRTVGNTRFCGPKAVGTVDGSFRPTTKRPTTKPATTKRVTKRTTTKRITTKRITTKQTATNRTTRPTTTPTAAPSPPISTPVSTKLTLGPSLPPTSKGSSPTSKP